MITNVEQGVHLELIREGNPLVKQQIAWVLCRRSASTSEIFSIGSFKQASTGNDASGNVPVPNRSQQHQYA